MRIVYYTYGGPTRGSTRLRALIPGRFLRTLGHEVIFNPDTILPSDVAVFQKRADLVSKMKVYKKNGTLVVLDVSDYGDYPAQFADVTVVGTKRLATIYPGATIIPDVLDIQGNPTVKETHKDKLQDIVWFGAAENTDQAIPVGLACRKLGLTLHMISNHHAHRTKRVPHAVRHNWSLADIDQMLIKYDLVVCPFILAECQGFKSLRKPSYLSCKSINRPLKAWALGLPVIGSPIPSYVECGVTHLATTVTEWTTKLDELRSRTLREEDVARGKLIADEYRVEKLIPLWLHVFKNHVDDTETSCCLSD